MRDLLPNLDNSRSSGTHWVAYNKNKNNIHYFDSFENLQPPREVVKYLGHRIQYNYDRVQDFDTCASLFYFLS